MKVKDSYIIYGVLGFFATIFSAVLIYLYGLKVEIVVSGCEGIFDCIFSGVMFSLIPSIVLLFYYMNKKFGNENGNSELTIDEQEEEPEEFIVTCVHCKKEYINPINSLCSNCGKNMYEKVNYKKCSFCGSEFESSLNECPFCGITANYRT